VASGADVVVEHGVVSGEVRGLEVCRAVTDTHTGEHRLEVGIGAHDREAFQLLHGNMPTLAALSTVVETVEVHRRPGAEPHPLNRLAAERLLRWEVIHDPSWLGAAELHPLAPPRPRSNVKDPVPCAAIGTADDGSLLTVVCTSGIDLTAIPFAIDVRIATGVQRCIVVVRPRDLSPVTQRLAALVRPPVEVVAFPS
jgi:hypothetical protein